MRKFLSKKYWSLGTSLGSLGPLSQGDVILGFGRTWFLVILGPYSHFFIVACPGHAENPKLIAARCDYDCAFTFNGLDMNPAIVGLSTFVGVKGLISPPVQSPS